MSLETSYEVQEMLRDDGVQTFRAKEKATGRGLELHLFPPFGRPENKLLFERVKGLPLETRRKFLDIGIDGSTPYVVTDPLPPGRTFKAWVEELISGVQKASFATTAPIDPIPTPPSAQDGVQILQAGQWRTGTPIPDSLVWKPPAPPPPPPAPPPLPPEFSWVPTDDSTVVMRIPPVAPSAPTPPAPPPPTVTAAPVQLGEFTALFQAPDLKSDLFATQAAPAPPPAPSPSVGEFTGLFQSHKPSADLEGFQQAPPPAAAPVFASPTLASPTLAAPIFVAPSTPQAAPPQEVGEFTRMFQAPTIPQAAPPPPVAAPMPPPPAASQTPFFRQPEPQETGEFTKFFENPLKPAPMSSQPQSAAFEPPPPPPPAPHRVGEFTDIFGRPTLPSSGGYSERPQAPLPPPAAQGNVSATGLFTPSAWSQPQAQPTFGTGPSEYTKMMSAPAVPTLGQPGYGQAQAAAPLAAAPKKSNLPIFIAIAVAVLLVIAIAVFLLMHGAASTAATPAAK